jgi:hypothetical protein
MNLCGCEYPHGSHHPFFRKEFTMVLPLIPLAAAGLYGLYKAADGALAKNDATHMNNTAESVVSSARALIETSRTRTNAVLEDYRSKKYQAYETCITQFLETFGRLKNVEAIHSPELEKLNLGDFSTVSLQGLQDNYAMLKSSGMGLGAGFGGGAAMAFGAYSGTMMFATASTGTAISALSGAAATNATLAWLGGGAIASGGGGTALGTMVLGGIVAGPALAIFGHIVGNKGEEALNTAQSNLEQANTFRTDAALTCNKLDAIHSVVSLASTTFSEVSTRLGSAVEILKQMIDDQGYGVDYQKFPTEAREKVLRSVKLAQLLKAMIDTPILDENGNLVLATKKTVQEDITLALQSIDPDQIEANDALHKQVEASVTQQAVDRPGIVKLLRGREGEFAILRNCDVYVGHSLYAEKGEKKSESMRSSFKKISNEGIGYSALIMDITAFGSAKDGLLISGDSIFWKNYLEDKVHQVNIENLSSIRICSDEAKFNDKTAFKFGNSDDKRLAMKIIAECLSEHLGRPL